MSNMHNRSLTRLSSELEVQGMLGIPMDSDSEADSPKHTQQLDSQGSFVGSEPIPNAAHRSNPLAASSTLVLYDLNAQMGGGNAGPLYDSQTTYYGDDELSSSQTSSHDSYASFIVNTSNGAQITDGRTTSASRGPLRADASIASTIDEDGDETMEGDPEESATQQQHMEEDVDPDWLSTEGMEHAPFRASTRYSEYAKDCDIIKAALRNGDSTPSSSFATLLEQRRAHTALDDVQITEQDDSASDGTEKADETEVEENGTPSNPSASRNPSEHASRSQGHDAPLVRERTLLAEDIGSANDVNNLPSGLVVPLREGATELEFKFTGNGPSAGTALSRDSSSSSFNSLFDDESGLAGSQGSQPL